MFDAMHGTRQKDGTQRHFVVAGGVAANAALRGGLVALAEKSGIAFTAPPLNLCTDTGAMIAWAGPQRFLPGLVDHLTAPEPGACPVDPVRIETTMRSEKVGLH